MDEAKRPKPAALRAEVRAFLDILAELIADEIHQDTKNGGGDDHWWYVPGAKGSVRRASRGRVERDVLGVGRRADLNEDEGVLAKGGEAMRYARRDEDDVVGREHMLPAVRE